MIAILVDDNFNDQVVKGVLRRNPQADIVRARAIPELAEAKDPVVLEWAAQRGRVVLTHDVKTMISFAEERVTQGLPMPGLFLVTQKLSHPMRATIIEDLVYLIECSLEGEWEGRKLFLPIGL